MSQEEKFFVGVDIGGTNTVMGLVDARGKILDEKSFATGSKPAPDIYLDKLNAEIAGLIKKNGKNVSGIGIGAPNGNFYKGTVEQPPNLGWGTVPVASIVSKALNIPTLVTNDANAAALGEMTYGAAKEMKNFILITLGTGLGSGVVVNGELVYGAYGFAGELGHMTAVENGRQCGCGRYGCLETYASAGGICRTALELLSRENRASLIRDISPNNLTSEMLFSFAEKGDAVAIEAFNETGKTLGKKLADAIAVTEPQAIILFGGLANAGERIITPTQKALDESVLPIFRGKVKVMLSGLQKRNIAVLGAAALAGHYHKIN